MQRLFITGTDTEVGKTVVTACLAEAARASGLQVTALKPVASGVEEGFGEDATLLGEAAGHPPKVFTTYRAPVSPHRAALDEARPLDLLRLTAWMLQARGDLVLVEGVGGWRVPLALRGGGEPFEIRDLALVCQAPVIVVAADRLGVLSHTRLTVQAIRADGLPVVAVVLNRLAPSEGDRSQASNLADLQALLEVPVLALDPIDPSSAAQREDAGRRLWDGIEGRIPLNVVR